MAGEQGEDGEEPDRYTLPSGAHVEDHGEGVFRVRQTERTRVNEVWVTASDLRALAELAE